MEAITIKPHHLLDILKLHGKGLEVFIPDLTYGHDFYKVANKIINHEVQNVTFTIHGDDICRPCIYNKENSCTDIVSKTNNESKESHNINIDSILSNVLELEFDKVYDFNKTIIMLNQKLNYEIFKQAWSKSSDEEIDFRFTNTMLGLKKVIQLYLE